MPGRHPVLHKCVVVRNIRRTCVAFGGRDEKEPELIAIRKCRRSENPGFGNDNRVLRGGGARKTAQDRYAQQRRGKEARNTALPPTGPVPKASAPAARNVPSTMCEGGGYSKIIMHYVEKEWQVQLGARGVVVRSCLAPRNGYQV